VKPVEAASSAKPPVATPARPRTSTGGFAKQLTQATSTRGTVPPPTSAPAEANTPATATSMRAPVRGLVSAASRAAKTAAPEPQAQSQPQAQPQSTPVTAALAALPHPIALMLPTAIAAKPAVAPIESASARPVAPAPVDSSSDDDAPAAPPTAAAPTDSPPPDDLTPRTPLEQAVHDLLANLAGDTTKHDEVPDDQAAQAAAQTKLAATAEPVAAPRSTAVTPAAPAAPIAQPDAQQMQSAHHAHIVLGDDGDRVVMTVAVRGGAVNVTLKSPDEHTAAALARNAGSLDEAMRRRGLDLEQFQADHETPRQRGEQAHEQHEREPEPESTDEPFELEENV
jgi:hypothetical protein